MIRSRTVIKTTLQLTIFFFVIATSFSQDKQQITQKILNYPDTFYSTHNLVYQIKSDFNSDLDRAYAVYSWITNNIAYDYAAEKHYRKLWKPNVQGDPYTHYYKEIANYTFQSRIAICHGYSALYQDLCQSLGITTNLIVGNAKTTINDIGNKWDTNHAWNIIELEGQKYLIDPTWGAGAWNGGFVKNPSDFYFMTSPELFIQKHYPEQTKYTLLNPNPSKKAFLQGPLPITWNNTLVSANLPKSGIIVKPKSGEKTINFSLNVAKPITRLSIWYNGTFVNITDFEHVDNILTFSHTIASNYSKNRLMVYLNKKVALKFKVTD